MSSEKPPKRRPITSATTIFIDRIIAVLTIRIGRWMAKLGLGGSMAVIEEGQRAPDFTLVNQDGKRV